MKDYDFRVHVQEQEIVLVERLTLGRLTARPKHEPAHSSDKAASARSRAGREHGRKDTGGFDEGKLKLFGPLCDSTHSV